MKDSTSSADPNDVSAPVVADPGAAGQQSQTGPVDARLDVIKKPPTGDSTHAAGGVDHEQQIGKPPANRSFFARKRRLVLPILGSLAGTVILGIQTYILHQQAILLAKQTEVLSLDQSVHTRERVVAASGVDDSVRRLVSVLKSEANIEIGAPPELGGVLKVTNFSVNACLTANCAKALVDGLLRTTNDNNPHLDDDAARGLLRLSAFLQHLDHGMQPLLEAPSELNMNAKQDKLASLKALVTSGVTQCFFDPAKARDLSENLTRLRLVSSNAFFISMRIWPSAQIRALRRNYSQVDPNTTTGLLELQSAAADVMRWVGTAPQATFEEFISALANGYRSALRSLIDLDNQCSATISRDASALKSISVDLEH